MNEIRPMLDVRGRRFAVAASSFNGIVVEELVRGALSCLTLHGISEDDVTVAWVPGAFELPLLAQRLAAGGLYDGVIVLGAVIRGETAHFELVAAEAARGVQRVALDTGVPVAFGVLATEDLSQALERAGGKHGNKGWEAAMPVLSTASVLDQLPKE